MADGREYAILLLDGSDLPCANEAVLLGWRIGSWIVSIKEERGAGGEGVRETEEGVEGDRGRGRERERGRERGREMGKGGGFGGRLTEEVREGGREGRKECR